MLKPLQTFLTLAWILLTLWSQPCLAEKELPLSADQAFAFSAYFEKTDQLVLHWKIAPGYYLYRDKIHISLTPNDELTLDHVTFPAGIAKHDMFHGDYQIYLNELTLFIPVLQSNRTKVHLKILYQGCAEQGFCYAPIKKELLIDFSKPLIGKKIAPIEGAVVNPTVFSPQEFAQSIFTQKNTILVLLSFFGLGILLSLTPCILPMVPILSGIIINHRRGVAHHNRGIQTFSLSLAYVLGMAITYALAGIVIAQAGHYVQSELQRPWVIFLLSGIFILLALSLFGFYGLQLPPHWQQRLVTLSQRQKGGSYVGVFFMGSLSSLIVSPCVSPVLIGVLAYIAQTGDKLIGALALLAVGLGMGLPLLLLGASFGHLLPKAGKWMELIEKIAGLLMLGVAIWMLSRVLTGPLTLFLWSILVIGSAIYVGALSKAYSDKIRLTHGMALVVFIYGVILMIGAGLGNSDPFHPWENWQIEQPTFVLLKNNSQLTTQFVTAKKEKN